MKFTSLDAGLFLLALLFSCTKPTPAPATSEWLKVVVAEASIITVGEWKCSTLGGLDSVTGKLSNQSSGQIEFEFEGLSEPRALRVQGEAFRIDWEGGDMTFPPKSGHMR